MRHRNKTPQFGTSAKHRRAIVRNLLTSLVLEEKVETTLTQAKELRRQADRLVARTRRALSRENGGLREAIRYASPLLSSTDAEKKLIETIIPRAGTRASGFVRVARVRVRPTDRSVILRIWWTDAPKPTAPVDFAPVAEVKKVHKKAEKSNPGAHPEKVSKPTHAAPKSAAAKKIQEPGGKAQSK